MSSSERSPKRRRMSYSPASPPISDTKQFMEGHSLHTPPPSVHMSPSWQSQSLQTIPTPPSTASFPSQVILRSTEETTPVARQDGEGDVEMEDEDHRRTDHERIEPPPLLYRVSTGSITIALPDPAQDMIELYSLQNVQASVARRDPKTGEKINRLRKSYETKSRNLGIEGRNKATVQQGHLQGLIDPGWDALVAETSSMWDAKHEGLALDGSGPEELIGSLAKALLLKPGRFPKAEHLEWTQQLGLDEPLPIPIPVVKPGLIPSKSTNSLLLARTNPMATGRATAPSSPAFGIRPDRAGKKRRYDESSYEGYDDDGYSTGGVDDTGRLLNGIKRIKRKATAV